jgi:hypothetical protein
MSKKLITDELIEERLEVKGFSEAKLNDRDLAREAVCDHFDVEITNDWSNTCDFFMYEETTADGYSVYIATEDTERINISEDVHYYDHSLFGELVDFIKNCNTGSKVYVDDLYQDFIDDAMGDLYTGITEELSKEIINELIDEGYEE